MSASLRYRLSPTAGIVTLAVGIGFMTILRVLTSSSETSFAVPRQQSVQTNAKYEFYAARRVEPSAAPSENPTQFSCYDPHLLPIWHELKKDTEFKDRVRGEAGELSCSDVLELKPVDLNSDGSEEFLVRGKDSPVCSPVGNCGFWIVGKLGKRVRLLLSSSDYNGESELLGEQIQRSRTSGYSNILLKGHFSAAETSYTTYSFDGKKYVESRCMYEVPKYDRQGEGSMEMVTCNEFQRRMLTD
jgi:hypothetical protein